MDDTDNFILGSREAGTCRGRTTVWFVRVEFDVCRSYPREMTIGQTDMRPSSTEEKSTRGSGVSGIFRVTVNLEVNVIIYARIRVRKEEGGGLIPLRKCKT